MLVAGNWKMYKGPSETAAFLDAFDPPLGVDVVVCPPYVSLAVAVGRGVSVYAQNVHWSTEGAFTGEVSAEMLLELGVDGAIVGHSERRQHFGETDETVARRAEAALAAGLGVIACVGETGEERETGRTEAVLRRQLSVLPRHERLVIAYEPVWAIGTGRTATPQQAQDVHGFLRARLAALGAEGIAVLYGGSVKAANAGALFAMPDVDGGLVGGASLDATEFLAIAAA
ncbi:MAG: triose-phosphate isomerase [Thermoleophilia bacterium]|nr:triose-phosphate isomerase [Thermoleophilia bacterium]